MAFGAVEVDFDQSVAYLERILGHQLHSMQSSRCTYHLSEQVEDFYEQKDWQKHEDTHLTCVADEDSTHLSVSYDGKAVPIMRSQTGRAQESVSTRLSKGQKKGVKKEATVSVSSSFTAKQRSAEDIITHLFSCSKSKPPGQPVEDKRNWHENKHIRAFISDKQKAIAYGIDNVLKRDDSGAKPIIVLIDGDRALEKAIQQTLEEKGIPHRVNAYILVPQALNN